MLTRKPGEAIRIGDNIMITVLEHRHGKIRIGITAPPEVKIHREEIAEQIARGVTRQAGRVPGQQGVV